MRTTVKRGRNREGGEGREEMHYVTLMGNRIRIEKKEEEEE